jgi:hypothetical protein
MFCSGFIGEGGFGGSIKKKKTGSSQPNSTLVPTRSDQHSSPATDS